MEIAHGMEEHVFIANADPMFASSAFLYFDVADRLAWSAARFHRTAALSRRKG
jgi:hypothetical protein